MISLFPLLILPKDTTPSTSDTTAGLEGLRASNNSVTLGSPPVISPAFPDFLGIFTKVFPLSTLSPLSTIRCAPTGSVYERNAFPSLSSIIKEAIIFLFLESVITFSWKPVCSSTSTW